MSASPILLVIVLCGAAALPAQVTDPQPPVSSYPTANTGQTPTNSASLCDLKNKTVTAKLMSPLSTSTAKAGDVFTTSVDAPLELQGALVEGRVASLTRAEKGFGKEKPKIQLSFTSLTLSGRSCPINGELKAVSNSKGVKNVDEEGRAVGSTSNKKRVGATVGGALFGAAIGALGGGAGGAIAGAGAGAAAGFILSSTMTAVGTDIDFKPGSIFTLEVSTATRKAQR